MPRRKSKSELSKVIRPQPKPGAPKALKKTRGEPASAAFYFNELGEITIRDPRLTKKLAQMLSRRGGGIAAEIIVNPPKIPIPPPITNMCGCELKISRIREVRDVRDLDTRPF